MAQTPAGTRLGPGDARRIRRRTTLGRPYIGRAAGFVGRTVEFLPRHGIPGARAGWARSRRAVLAAPRLRRLLRAGSRLASLRRVRGWAQALGLGPGRCSRLLCRRGLCGRSCGSRRPLGSRGSSPPRARGCRCALAAWTPDVRWSVLGPCLSRSRLGIACHRLTRAALQVRLAREGSIARRAHRCVQTSPAKEFP